jgi:hypothetical protein
MMHVGSCPVADLQLRLLALMAAVRLAKIAVD